MAKSPDAFRTISEVADWLDVPTHVLRFWESRFTQVKPVKRAGGRRYYRPADMELLGGIKRLLHDEGLTIRGVQKLLREEGVRHVAALSPPVGGEVSETGGKVITLVPNPPDAQAARSWTPGEDAEEAVETLSARIENEASGRDGDIPKDGAEPLAAPASDHTPQESLPAEVIDTPEIVEGAQSDAEPGPRDTPAAPEPEVVQTSPPPPDASVDVPVPAGADTKAVAGKAALPDIPLPDPDAFPDPPLCIAPLIAKGSAGRNRDAETFAPIAARAKALLRDLNLRM